MFRVKSTEPPADYTLQGRARRRVLLPATRTALARGTHNRRPHLCRCRAAGLGACQRYPERRAPRGGCGPWHSRSAPSVLMPLHRLHRAVRKHHKHRHHSLLGPRRLHHTETPAAWSAGVTASGERSTTRTHQRVPSPGCARARLRCWSRSERDASDATAQPSTRSRRRPARARAVSRRGIPPRAGSVGRTAANRRAARPVVRPPRSLSPAVPATSTGCLRPVLTRFLAARFS